MSSTLEKHAVPGQAAGYAYQFDLALDQLADGSSGGRVGIETLDDVAKEEDGAKILRQGKISVAEHSTPFGDNSFGLWNALHTWCDALTAGEISPLTDWLDLVSNTVIPDCLARQIGEAATGEQVKQCIATLRTVPSVPSVKAKPHVAAVRALDDNQLASLIQRVRCFGRDEGMSIGAIHRRVAAKLKLPSGVDPVAVIEELLGWIKVQVHRMWDAKLPAWIKQQDFNNRLHAAIEKNRRRRVRELPARELVCTREEIEGLKTTCFVRQLELIDSDAKDIEEGILDFLRHNRERLRLTSEGDVADTDWTDFDDRLVQHWTPIFRMHTKDVAKNKRRKAGQAVFNAVQTHREALAGQPTAEYYLTRGALHRLADELSVGWHPDFEPLCKPYRKVG